MHHCLGIKRILSSELQNAVCSLFHCFVMFDLQSFLRALKKKKNQQNLNNSKIYSSPSCLDARYLFLLHGVNFSKVKAEHEEKQATSNLTYTRKIIISA